MLRYVYRYRLGSGYVGLDRLSFVALKGFFTGQLKATVGGQNIFDPMKGAANGTFGALVIVGEGLHRCVFPVVFQGDKKFIADGQGRRFAA